MKKLFSLVLVAALLCGAAVLPAHAADWMFLIPDSNTRLLTESELWEWDYESLGYILNEIFARHGYVFEAGGKYDNYFSSLPWYTPNSNPDNSKACYSQLNNTEWKNEALVKKVRADMRAMGTTNNKGTKSVWDHYSSGFDTLNGFEYTQFKANQKFTVYSAPTTNAPRGSNGKASVSTNGAVFIAGEENGWMMVMYETNGGSVRVGYFRRGDVKGKVQGTAWNKSLNFAYLSARVTASCTVTDDPVYATGSLGSLRYGDQVTYLNTYYNRRAWDYIEFITAEGKTARGFVPVGCLDYGVYEKDSIGE
ncbi:MAG: YARHG domain-containing protein [Clostridia bacterium]|nr:YARHG domain-containing protein [Clostridia bacterium]